MEIGRIGADIESLSAEIERANRNPGLQGFKTGIKCLDEILRGIRNETYGIIAGRTGQGKTALALSMARSLVEEGKTAGFLSLEMSIQQLQYRLLASLTGKRQQDIVEGYVKIADLDYAIDALEQMNMLVNIDLSLDLRVVEATIAKMAATCDVLFVDYVQLIKVAKARDRVAELGQVSKTMVELARKHKLPIIGLAQLNRGGVEKPSLHHLKGAGDLEEDAAFVIAIHRPEIDEDDPYGVDKDVIELHVLKNRFGDIGVAEANFDRARMKFTCLT